MFQHSLAGPRPARLGVKLRPPRAARHLQHLMARVLGVAGALPGGGLTAAGVLRGW
jgi:hypothetical protein